MRTDVGMQFDPASTAPRKSDRLSTPTLARLGNARASVSDLGIVRLGI